VKSGTAAHLTIGTKVKNTTRWLGLWDMSNRNRRIKSEIAIALTGSSTGFCDESPAANDTRALAHAHSDSSSDDDSDDDSDQEEANRSSSKEFPMAHRCLDSMESSHNNVFESVLDRAREVTLIGQS
jgi:hypothetical protein